MEYNSTFEFTDTMIARFFETMENIGKPSSVKNLEKLPPLRKVSKLKSIQSSLAIENNSLPFTQVSDAIKGKKVLGRADEILATKNAFQAYGLVSQFGPFSITNLLEPHGIRMHGLTEPDKPKSKNQ